MSYLHAIILSIVEGITEFLPVSSTGHLVLAASVLGIAQTDFVKSFEIAIQLGAILAVVLLYLRTLLVQKKILVRLAVAFVPSAVFGAVFYRAIKGVLLGNSAVTLWAIFLGGIAIIAFEYWYREQEHHLEKIEDISLPRAFMVGIFQSISMIPGVSRAAATIVGGLSAGLRRRAAVEFSFLLAIPTMLAATALDMAKSGWQFTSAEYGILGAGFLGAFVTALIAVKYFLRFIERHTFVPFGIYRIALAVAFWMFITV